MLHVEKWPKLSCLSLALGLETKEPTCYSIVKLEMSLTNLDAKSSTLEQHRSNGTLPKDLLLSRKSLFVDEQPKVDDILLTASNALLSQRIAKISRKKSVNFSPQEGG